MILKLILTHGLTFDPQHVQAGRLWVKSRSSSDCSHLQWGHRDRNVEILIVLAPRLHQCHAIATTHDLGWVLWNREDGHTERCGLAKRLVITYCTAERFIATITLLWNWYLAIKFHDFSHCNFYYGKEKVEELCFANNFLNRNLWLCSILSNLGKVDNWYSKALKTQTKQNNVYIIKINCVHYSQS